MRMAGKRLFGCATNELRKLSEYVRPGFKSQPNSLLPNAAVPPAALHFGKSRRRPLPRNMIIQIYEIQTPREVADLIDLGVDHIGSVLLSEEEWEVPDIRLTLRQVAELGGVSSLIPLFNTPATVLRVLSYDRPHVVHFCEQITPHTRQYQALIALQQEIRTQFPAIRIMRSVPIGLPAMADSRWIRQIAQDFAPVSDIFLTDTLLTNGSPGEEAAQPVNGFVGITGQPCDWQAAAELVSLSPIPVILAGGLAPENVYDAVLQVRPAGVDSCTGTNARDDRGRPIRFRKDPQRVRQFVAEVRRAERALGA